ncbi:MAG: aspartate aminotransferase family protein [Candidatus Kapabacteria bacterium]|nr:aspartate aminotransferase family protein [Ignavibacteriota bacterium]MCW5885415.1 aspartate aminotransferase family protein [Candidatus Kapabacteria bacterium]
MNSEEFRKYGREIVDFIADYLESNEKFPVKSQVKPGDIFSQIPNEPPNNPEPFDTILKDFQDIILPGITHWQSPNFYAYFSSNNSYESILGDLMSSGLGVHAFSWETSPSATELEEAMMIWLRKAIGLSAEFTGVIQDTASTATLCSLLTARDKRLRENPALTQSDISKFRIYCSKEAHSSIERAAMISGIGYNNLIRIDVDEAFSLRIDSLEKQIKSDLASGLIPLCIVSALGTTGSLAVDPIGNISDIAKKYGLWHHIDAAYSGNAMILDEYKYLAGEVKNCDTFVFNPHKWLFINFDFSAYFVKDKAALISTFEILPEYLKTSQGSQVNNYRDWGIQLGRRFRALKAWFVLRGIGLNELKSRLREHNRLANIIYEEVKKSSDFELMAPLSFNLVCFRYKPEGINDDNELNVLNENILNKINSTGKIFLTKTKLAGKTAIRIVTGTSRVNENFVRGAWEIISKEARAFT